MINMNKHFYLVILILLLSFSTLAGQAVLSSNERILGRDIYSDFKSKSTFYYAPGKLRLATEMGGQPKFQLVQMRYTGTACYNYTHI